MILTAFILRIFGVFEVQDLHFPHLNLKPLPWSIFKFVLLRHILIGHTNISFCVRLNFNPFIPTFVHFTIVVLTWYDFTTYSIVLPMYISAWVFHTLKFYFRCIIYITT